MCILNSTYRGAVLRRTHVFGDVWQRYSSGQLSGAGLVSRSEYSPMTELFANLTL